MQHATETTDTLAMWAAILAAFEAACKNDATYSVQFLRVDLG